MRKTRGGWGETGRLSPIFPAATVPFPKSCASYFRFTRFNTFPLYHLRTWHRLPPLWLLEPLIKSGICPEWSSFKFPNKITYSAKKQTKSCRDQLSVKGCPLQFLNPFTIHFITSPSLILFHPCPHLYLLC